MSETKIVENIHTGDGNVRCTLFRELRSHIVVHKFHKCIDRISANAEKHKLFSTKYLVYLHAPM